MKTGKNQLDRQCDRILQRIDQRSKTNNYPALQVVTQNCVQPSTVSEDTKSLLKLKDQLLQFTAKYEQESARLVTVQLETSRKNIIIDRLVSINNQDLADRDRVIEEQANILMQKDKKIAELEEKMGGLLERIDVSKYDKTVSINCKEISKRETNLLTGKENYYQEIEVGELSEIVVLDRDYVTDDDILSDFVIVNGGISIEFD